MTTTLPDGMERKDMAQVCADAVSTGVWGSEYPEVDGVRNHIVAVTGVRDEVGDIIVPGAFVKTLQRLTPKACMGHDWNRAIGEPEAIEELMPGDPRLPKLDRFDRPWNPKAGALFARTRYNLAKKDGQDAYADATFHGPRLACSIGYVDPKDDNGKPLHSYKAIDPDTGLMTRFLPELDLFEYSQVLHGAHPLAGGLKTGKPKRLERKRARPSMEIKATVRLVRDSAYWGLPLGTPIRAGMKPQGPKARRLVAAGQQADTGAGAVEVDANNLRIKPTAKGKQKGNVAVSDAYSGIMSLLDDEASPFEDSFETEDTQKINKGEPYNPLDILVANAVPPADVEEQLRNNSDWDADRLGDAAERQDEIDSYVADVVDAYREKYNAELVRQNDTGDSEVDDTAAPEEPQPDTRTGNEQEEDRRYQAAVDRAAAIPSQEQQRAQSQANREAAQRGEIPLRPGEAAPAVPAPAAPTGPTRISAEDQAEITRLKQNGRDNEAAKLYREAVQRARAAEGVTLEQISPTRTRLRQQQVNGEVPADAEMPQAAPGAPEMAVHNGDPVNIRAVDGDTANVYNTRTEQVYDVPVGELLTGGASLDAPVDITLNDAQREAADLAFGNGESIEEAGAVLTASGVRVGNIAEALATIDTRFEVFEDNPEQKRRHGRTLKAIRTKIAKLAKPGEPIQPDAAALEALPGNVDADAQPSTEVAPEEVSGQSTVDPMAAPEQPVAPSDADITRMVTAKPDAAAAQAAQMGDAELAAYDAAMSDRAAELGKPGQRTPGHQAVADELARRAEAGPVEGAVGEPLGETDPAMAGPVEPGIEQPAADDELVEDIDQAQAEAIEQDATEEITGDELADAEEIIDASFGVTEAPDGEFEVDDDIADRQDRVATLLKQADTGGLDFSGAADDQLRVTRADIVDELRLQEHLERRRTGEQAVTRQQAETQASDDLIPQEEADEQPVDTGPKPRPGVAGAAEDLADALDDGDQARIDAATDRLRKSVNRSRSDSEVVAEIRAMLDAPSTEADPITGEPLPGRPDPATLRDAAQRLREEQRAKRNEGARRRRTARRFERERLRSLLGQVEAEMRNRNLDYDPLPDADGNVTLDLNTTPAVAWASRTDHETWSGTDIRADELSGANYEASVSVIGNRTPAYRWTVTSDDGTVLATGSGTAPDVDSARASVEIALDTQRKLGLIPIDAQIPQGHVPEDTSATPLGNVVDAIRVMRERLDGGRALNPITGQPDPFGEQLAPLEVPAQSRFADAAQVRKYLETRAVPTRQGGDSVVNTYRWDTAKMTPGGAFAIVDDLRGDPQVVHTVTGATFPPPLIGKSGLGRADLLRYATIAESLRDSDGRPVDWNLGARELMDSLKGRSFGGDGGQRDLRDAAINRLTREKIQSGAFTHALVQRDLAFIDGVTNESRRDYVNDQHRTLAQLINVNRGKPDAFDKKTLAAATSAQTLAALGAPDAAAVLLTRRAAEIREQHGDDAHSRGAAVLDSLATGYLGMFSPMRSHGERIRSLKPGEQVFLSGDSEGDPPRGFRVLAVPRRDPRGGASETLTPVIDEKTGEQRFLRTVVNEFRIEDTEDIRYGYNPLSASLSGGRNAFVVVGPGEEPPATEEDLRARQFDDAAVIPQDVLDAAAEALPETASETATRRAVPTNGVRPPRRRSPAAPKRTALPPAAPEPVRGEQHLAEAQGRIEGAFLGMPFAYGDAPQRGSFGNMNEAREHLAALETGASDPKVASTARATLALVDGESVKLSPGGVFLVGRDGTISHISSGFKVWPPALQGSNRAMLDDLHGGGYRYSQAASMRIARALESGVFDSEQLDWSGDGMAAVKQSRAIADRHGGFHPIQTAQRAAYLNGVLDAPKPPKTDLAMFGGIADQLDLEGPNPEAFDRTALLSRKAEYSNSSGYAAESKKGADLVTRISTELRLAEPLAKTAPLDAVRRLTRLADELDGQTIMMRISAAHRDWRVAMAHPVGEPTKTLTPSDDLRKAAKMITDVYDPNKISESGKFRRAGMVGQVELTKPKITMGRTWEDPNGVAGRRLETAIKNGGGIRFYRDADGHLHATFTASETGVTVDIVEGQVQVGGGTTGAIKLAPDGRLTLSYLSANRLIVIEGAPGSWKFTPEESENGDTGADISGPETGSAQVGDGDSGDADVDVTEDIREIERLANDEEE